MAGTEMTDVGAVTRRAAEAAQMLEGIGRARRAQVLDAIADAIDADRGLLVEIADDETGLGTERLNGELTRTAFQFRLFAEVLREGGYLDATIDHAADTPMGARPDLRRMSIPLGPVAVFAASNFPFAFGVAGGDTASALAAGCPVVAKAHPSQPRTADALAGVLHRVMQDFDLPVGVIGLVHGVEHGIQLIEDDRITAAGFTGSIVGGRALFDVASRRRHPIPFYGELGSVNPLIVTPAAAKRRSVALAEGIVGSMTLGVGQFCTKPGLIFLPTGVDGDRLEQGVAEAVQRSSTSRMLNDVIASAYDTEISRRRTDTRLREVATGGGEHAATVFTIPSADLHDNLVEECFGPSALIVRYGSEDDLVTALDRLDGQLTTTLQSEPEEAPLARRLTDVFRARAGRIVYDGYPTGVAVAWSMHHGGPYPATTSSANTSVGPASITRWLRPVAYQNAPATVLPPELHDDNPLAIPRRVDGVLQPA